MKKSQSLIKFCLGLYLLVPAWASAVQAEDRDRLVGSGAQSCAKAKQIFTDYDLARDQSIEVVPAIAHHKLVTDAYQNQLREFALGMLQAELLKTDADPRLFELENFNYVGKFLDLCRNGATGDDVLFHTFVTQVVAGEHKLQWLRTTR